MPKVKSTWPAWYSGPKGETKIFANASDVPEGWTTGAEKASLSGAKPAKVSAPATPPAKADEKPAAPAAKAVSDEIDAHGHKWDENLHAATKTKTKDGLWRMKVGVKRPDPLPGYPLDL